MLSEEIRKEIEPEVREAVKRLYALRDALKAGADIDTLADLGYQVECQLGSMLPTIHGKLDVTLLPHLAGMTFTARAA